MALADEWVAVHDFLEGPHLDDLVLLRLDHVTKVRPHPDDPYVSRAVAGLGVPVREFECAADSTAGDLLRSIAEMAELVAVHMECWEGEPLYVGKIRRVGKKRVDLHFVGRDGVWVDFVDAWKLKDITRIEFGGQYIRALELFSDPMPVPGKRKKR